MKKLLFTLVTLILSTMTIAGNFVMISYSGRAELEKHFFDPNLTVHFYTNSEVFATAECFDSHSMVMIDETAFSSNECYTLVYCPKEQQRQYKTLYSTQDYVIVSGTWALESYKGYKIFRPSCVHPITEFSPDHKFSQ